MIAALVQDATHYRTPLLIAAALVAAALLALVARRLVRRMPPGTPVVLLPGLARWPDGQPEHLLAVLRQRLGITGAEQVIMFSVVEQSWRRLGPMNWDNTDVVLAAGVMLLLGIALSNSWQLVISHESSTSTMDSDGKGAVRVIPDLPRTQ